MNFVTLSETHLRSLCAEAAKEAIEDWKRRRLLRNVMYSFTQYDGPPVRFFA